MPRQPSRAIDPRRLVTLKAVEIMDGCNDCGDGIPCTDHQRLIIAMTLSPSAFKRSLMLPGDQLDDDEQERYERSDD